MSLNQSQWFDKLKSWVPSWFFQKSDRNNAVFQGIAKVLAQYQSDADDHFEQTFIDSAEGEILDLHGSERGVFRISGEQDIPYRPRIKLIKNSSNCPTLKELVDSQLVNQESQFIENAEINNFLDREAFLNRDIINTRYIYNAFTILVPNQIKYPETFLDRENFCSRGDFLGQTESSLSLFERIVDMINQNKAFGTFYALIERQ